MMKTDKLLLAISLSALGLLPSCHHKDLEVPSDMSELYVVFDWRNAPDANPSSMAMYLYEETGDNPLRYIFDNKDGGEIKAPAGTHHAICVNADNTDWARMRHSEDVDNLEIYTMDAADLRQQSQSSTTRADGSENERMAQTPGMLYGSRSNNIQIHPRTGRQTITLYPEEVVCHYIVDVYDVENIGTLKSTTLDASLSGMAEGYNHGAHNPTEVPVTMAFTLTSDSSSDSLHGEYLTFGECPTTTAKHNLTIYMIQSDGRKWFKTFDVTDQVTKAPDPRHVHIIVRGLPLPEPPDPSNPVSGGGLNPDVNNWQQEYIDLEM